MTVPGNLYVISAPSGTGKTSLVKALEESLPNLKVSISHTTRPQRPGEGHSKNYYFVDKKEFLHMIEGGEFLEYATVFHHFYGTSHAWVEQTLAKGLDVILEIDWQGGQQIRKKFPDCISIFILPPSLNDLSDRLKKRNQDKHEVIQERLADARETMMHIQEFDYVVINADFDHAVNDLKTILLAGRLLQKRQSIQFANLLTELARWPTNSLK
jgi:guanylate kinase